MLFSMTKTVKKYTRNAWSVMEIDLHAIKSVVYCYLLLHRRSKKLESRGELAPKGQKLRPKAKSRSGLLGERRAGPGGAQPWKKTLFGHNISLKCIQAPFSGFKFHLFYCTHL